MGDFCTSLVAVDELASSTGALLLELELFSSAAPAMTVVVKAVGQFKGQIGEMV